MRRRVLVVAFACVAAGALSLEGQATGTPGAGASADTKPPSQTIFASSRQGIRSVYLLITVHEPGKLNVTAKAGSYRFRSYSRDVVAHIPNEVKLKLSASALRSARKALRDGKRMTAVVKSTARDDAGNERTYTRRIKLKP